MCKNLFLLTRHGDIGVKVGFPVNHRGTRLYAVSWFASSPPCSNGTAISNLFIYLIGPPGVHIRI